MLWNKEQEKNFFTYSLNLTSPEKLFYVTEDQRFLAYWPNGYKGKKDTLQSRNAFIGSYTNKWTAALFSNIAKEVGGYSVEGIVCEDIGLTKQSKADVAICKTNAEIQRPGNILIIIEVKMSVVWNWEFIPKGKSDFDLKCIGDYTTHQGNPSLLRSDTMLKAIGKSINIRVSSRAASKIPIIVIGNTPITEHYYGKVDHLRRNGVVQGFWSVNPKPLHGDNGRNIKNTRYKGFYRFDDYNQLKQNMLNLLKEEREFFSSMQTKRRLGEIIEIANREPTYEAKAQRFLELLGEANE